MNWYKQSQDMPLFENKDVAQSPAPIQKVKTKEDKGLTVSVFENTAEGRLGVTINGKPYSYQLPYNAQEMASLLMNAQARGRGKYVKQLIDSLKRYLIN